VGAFEADFGGLPDPDFSGEHGLPEFRVAMAQVQGVPDAAQCRGLGDAEQRPDFEGEELGDPRGAVVAGLDESFDTRADRVLVDLPAVCGPQDADQFGDLSGDQLLMRVIDRVQDLVVRLVLDHGAGQHGLNTRGDQHRRR